MGIVQVLTAKDEEPVLRLAISEMQRLLQVTHSQHSGRSSHSYKVIAAAMETFYHILGSWYSGSIIFSACYNIFS